MGREFACLEETSYPAGPAQGGGAAGGWAEVPAPKAPPLLHWELAVEVEDPKRPSFSANNPTFSDFRASDPFPSQNFAFRLKRTNVNKTEGVAKQRAS